RRSGNRPSGPLAGGGGGLSVARRNRQASIRMDELGGESLAAETRREDIAVRGRRARRSHATLSLPIHLDQRRRGRQAAMERLARSAGPDATARAREHGSAAGLVHRPDCPPSPRAWTHTRRLG